MVLQKRGAISLHGGQVNPQDYMTRSSADQSLEKALAKARPLEAEMPAIFKRPQFTHLVANPLIFGDDEALQARQLD